jgi:hypothetical protein
MESLSTADKDLRGITRLSYNAIQAVDYSTWMITTQGDGHRLTNVGLS